MANGISAIGVKPLVPLNCNIWVCFNLICGWGETDQRRRAGNKIFKVPILFPYFGGKCKCHGARRWRTYPKYMGTIWEQYGNNMGTIWEQYGNNMGTIWEQYGNNIGIILSAECSLHWQSIICTITSSSLRQSRLCYRKYVPSEKYGNNMGTIWKQYIWEQCQYIIYMGTVFTAGCSKVFLQSSQVYISVTGTRKYVPFEKYGNDMRIIWE